MFGQHRIWMCIDGRPVETGSCEDFFKAVIQPLGDDCTWNLTDELTANFANDGPGPDGASAFYFSHPPRSFALQAQINFNGS